MPLTTTAPTPLQTPRRLLVVKFAEIGDALTITPALGALRTGLPETRIDALTTGGGAAVLKRSGLCDNVIVFDKHRFDTPRQMLKPTNVAAALRFRPTTLRDTLRYSAVVSPPFYSVRGA